MGKGLIIFIVLFLLVYMSMSFASGIYNPLDWDYFSKAFLVVVGVWLNAVLCIIIVSENEV